MKLRPHPAVLGIPFLLIALALPALSAEDTAQDPAKSATGTAQAQPQPAAAPAASTLKYSRFHRVLGRNLTSNLFTRKNLAPFVIGSAAALAIAPADQEISQGLWDHAPEFGDAGQIIGGVVTVSFVGGSVVASCLTKNDHLRSFGYTLAQAYATNFIITRGLKYATHRMRPDGSASTSFPSGHASDSFTIATVMWSYYGKKWGIPLCILAGLVGVSRIEQGRHWPSDAIAGAAVGYISAQTAIRGTKRELSGKKGLSGLMVLPVYGHDRRGVSVRLDF
jgi:membrane-associated phospholipid phosphatase